MKFFAVFAAVLALTAANTTQWTLHQLDTALSNPATPAEYVPYLEEALNTLMESMFTGQPMGTITVSTPAGLLPVEAITPIEVAPVIAAEATTEWTLHELSMALQNPATPAEYVPYLEDALNALMESMFSGKPVDTIAVPTPAGLLPVEAILPIEMPSPVAVAQPEPVVVVESPAAPAPVPAPIAPAPVPAPIAPAPVAVPELSGSPLVQIIVNIKSQEAAPVAPAPEAPETVVVPELPVIVAPSPVELPEAPEPVVIAPEAPESVVIAPTPIEIAPAPEVPEAIVIPESPALNPIDVIAVGAPEVNPIDLLQPVPVAVAAGEGQLV